jgi:hypothetical protein
VTNRALAAVLITAALSAASCSVSPDGLAVTGVDETGDDPATRAGMAPAAIDGGAASVSSSAPPAVSLPDAGAAPPVMPPMTGGAPAMPPASPVAPPMAAPPMTTPPPAPRVMRAHDVKAKRIIATTVHVHKLEARNGTAGRVIMVAEPLVALELGPENVEVDELVVDTLYAHDVKADHVQIVETHASEVKIGKKGNED